MVSGGQLTPGSALHEAQYGLSDLRLIVAEAHRLGLRTAAHAHCPGSIADAVAAGFDTLEHVTFSTEHGVAADPATMAALVESGTVLSVTVGEVPGKGELPLETASRHAAVFEVWTRLHRVGARIVPGTDAGTAPFKPHNVLPHGITALTRIGMTNLEALRAATSVAADACGARRAQGPADPGRRCRPARRHRPTRSPTSRRSTTSPQSSAPGAGCADRCHRPVRPRLDARAWHARPQPALHRRDLEPHHPTVEASVMVRGRPGNPRFVGVGFFSLSIHPRTGHRRIRSTVSATLHHALFCETMFGQP